MWSMAAAAGAKISLNFSSPMASTADMKFSCIVSMPA